MLNKAVKLKYIAFIQLCSMVLIVLSHSIVRDIYYPSWTFILKEYIQIIGLISFMWCSGYLLENNSSLKRRGYVNYVVSRLKRLIIPYVVIQILMIFPKYMLTQRQDLDVNVRISNIIKGFFYPREGILPHLWFLPTLMIICILSPLLCKQLESKVSSLITLVILYGFILLPWNNNIFCISDVKKYLFWFFGGMLCAHYKVVRYFDSKRKILLILIITSTILALIHSPIQNLLLGSSYLLFMLFISKIITYSPFYYISNFTYPIYILSLPVQNMVEILLKGVRINWLGATTISFAFGIIIPIVISAAIRRVEINKKHRFISTCIGL